MSDLDEKEQNHVRAALRFLNHRLGTWATVADGLHCSKQTLKPVLSGKAAVSASLAIRVARLAGVMVDDLLVGKFLPPGACPNCGHVVTSDFEDENTVVEDARCQASGTALTLVK